jgi:hypothetical protein
LGFGNERKALPDSLRNLFNSEHALICREANITLHKTDYAHFLYSRQLSPDHPFKCRTVAANGVVMTSDGYFVIGEMGACTSTPGRLQFVPANQVLTFLNNDPRSKLEFLPHVLREISKAYTARF